MEKEEFIQAIIQSNASIIDQVRHHPVLVALSGGADSVALLRSLLELGITCRAAHCNFHLRGEESMRDERFVRDLCSRLGVPLSVKDFDVAAHQLSHGGSTEMACRELRYTWFEQERQHQGCALIAVAHHAQDQVETFFLNLLRGTGVRGLSGMSQLSDNIWRPLLHMRRSHIINYLSLLNQDYVTDGTNAENLYRRNRLRNIVLPTLEEQFPQASERILDTMSHLALDHAALISLINDVIPDERHIDIASLSSHRQATTLLYHRIRHLGFNRDQCVQAITASQHGHSGRKFYTNSHVMHLNRHSLDIEPLQAMEQIEIPIDLSTGSLTPVHITTACDNTPFSPQMCDGKTTVAFNRQVLNCRHIVLRHWRRGDRMKPFGLNGTKLVSDLFADFKLSHAAKQSVWILEADGKILWMIGYRASALYPVNQESQDYVLLKLISD